MHANNVRALKHGHGQVAQLQLDKYSWVKPIERGWKDLMGYPLTIDILPRVWDGTIAMSAKGSRGDDKNASA